MNNGGNVDGVSSLADLVGQALQRQRAGDLAGAEALYRLVLEQDPNHADALHLSGCLAGDQGRHDQAITLISRAIQRSPLAYPYYYNLANQLATLGRLDEAVGHLCTAIRLKPDYAFAHNNLGMALFRQGDRDGALVCYRKAIHLVPNYADPHYNLGLVLTDVGDLRGAIASYKEAIRIRPAYELAYYNLGNTYSQEHQLDAAVEAYRAALGINPDSYKSLTNLGSVLLKLGRLEEAIACFRKALDLAPCDVFSHSNVLLAMNYAAGYSPEEIFQQHVHFERSCVSEMAPTRAHDNTPQVTRRLRVGYVSGDFRWHAVAYFVEAALAIHDQKSFELYAYSNCAAQDAVTRRLMGYFDHWRDIRDLDDDQAAARIRQDGIDILVDLSGHTADNRLMVFARKPAPIQVTWLGYPNTTGLTAMDYRLTDGFAEPRGMTERYNVEQLWRLPDVFCCYTPSADNPQRQTSLELVVQPTPALKNGYITFGNFNNIAKMSPPVVALWARLLRELPTAKLMLEASGLETDYLRKQVEEQFAAQGISASRLILLGRKPEQQYVLYHQIDIALDPFPCSGGTTSFDTLWMGVPLVTLAGRTFVSRMGVSLLSNLGLSELIADSCDQYIAIARRLASDVPRLNALRLGIRPRTENSPLLDHARFTSHLETAFREMWRAWCIRSGHPSDTLLPAFNILPAAS